MLTAVLLSLMNMCRGNATIKHWQWLALAAWVIYCQTLSVTDTLLWMWIVIVVTIFATKPLLNAVNGDKKGIAEGFVRNLAIIPALIFLHNWWPLVLLAQGLLYYICGKIWVNNSVRLAEGLTGLILGLLIIIPVTLHHGYWDGLNYGKPATVEDELSKLNGER